MVLFLLPEDTSFRWSVIPPPLPPRSLLEPGVPSLRPKTCIGSHPQCHLFESCVQTTTTTPSTPSRTATTISNIPLDMLNCPLHNLSYATHRGGLERFKTNQTGSIPTGQIFVACIPWCSSTDPRLYSDPERWQHSGDRIPKSPACWDRHELHCCSLEQVRVLRETQWGSYQRRGE